MPEYDGRHVVQVVQNDRRGIAVYSVRNAEDYMEAESTAKYYHEDNEDTTPRNEFSSVDPRGGYTVVLQL